VEKNYVLGWLTAGINAYPKIFKSWELEGGTCLKKCYFETYRLPEDLDFTLPDESHLDENFQLPVLQDVAAWVTEQSGPTIPPDQLTFDMHTNPKIPADPRDFQLILAWWAGFSAS
jgi:hypothetical protein